MTRTSRLTLLALLLVAAPAAAGPAVLTVASPHSLEETVVRLRDSIGAHNFRLLREQELGGPGSPVRTLYFCNFEMLARAYRADRRIGYMLPCRITVTEDEHGVRLSTVDPVHAARAAGVDTHDQCSELRAAIVAIMTEATL